MRLIGFILKTLCSSLNQIFHYSRCIMRKRASGAHFRVNATAGNTAPFVEMSQRWQHCVRFDSPEI